MNISLIAAFNTLNARFLELKFAKWFGEERFIDTGEAVVRMARWRGKDYFIDSVKTPQNRDGE